MFNKDKYVQSEVFVGNVTFFTKPDEVHRRWCFTDWKHFSGNTVLIEELEENCSLVVFHSEVVMPATVDKVEFNNFLIKRSAPIWVEDVLFACPELEFDFTSNCRDVFTNPLLCKELQERGADLVKLPELQMIQGIPVHGIPKGIDPDFLYAAFHCQAPAMMVRNMPPKFGVN